MLLLERYKSCKNRPSTAANYLSIWRQFNTFLMRLDHKPKLCEDRATLFGAALIESEIQSSTLKSYFSAIKSILIDDNYEWDDNRLMIRTLTRACRAVNDKVRTRLPIHLGLLEIILFEVECLFSQQKYLEILYKTIFILAYYGLFRIGELTWSTHTVEAKDVHMAVNKDELLLILYTSKMHGKESHPQKIKIKAVQHDCRQKQQIFCPFQLTRAYLMLHGEFYDDSDVFFIFGDHSPVKPFHVCHTLKRVFSAINLDHKLYNFHSFSSDLLKMGVPIDKIKLMGRWQSNTIFHYIRYF